MYVWTLFSIKLIYHLHTLLTYSNKSFHLFCLFVSLFLFLVVINEKLRNNQVVYTVASERLSMKQNVIILYTHIETSRARWHLSQTNIHTHTYTLRLLCAEPLLYIKFSATVAVLLSLDWFVESASKICLLFIAADKLQLYTYTSAASNNNLIDKCTVITQSVNVALFREWCQQSSCQTAHDDYDYGNIQV